MVKEGICELMTQGQPYKYLIYKYCITVIENLYDSYTLKCTIIWYIIHVAVVSTWILSGYGEGGYQWAGIEPAIIHKS